MAKRYQPNQRDKLKEHFSGHVYYRLCKMVHGIFIRHTPSIIMSADELFSDAAEVLDGILTSGDINAERCNELWSDTLREYRKLDGNSAGSLESQTEVAMLFYAVMLGLQSVCHSHYRGTLQRTLHGSIHQMWDKGDQKNCAKVETDLKAEVNVLTQEMLSWMEEYFVSRDTLTNSLYELLANQVKTEKTKEELLTEKKLKELTEHHKSLATTNKVLRELITMNMERWRICFSKFVLFIEEHFAQKCQNTYEWLAVYMFADNNSLMCNRDQNLFCIQMQEWFPNSQVNCPNNFRNFTILIGRNPDEWQSTKRTKNLTDAVVENVTKRYTELQDTFNIEFIAF